MNNKHRKLLLEELILNPQRAEEIIEELAAFDWDCDRSLVVLTLEKIANILLAIIADKLSVGDIYNWANAIEGRDDIAYDENNAERINALIYELANPYLTETLTKERAEYLLDLCR